MRSKKGKDFEFSIDPLLTFGLGSGSKPKNLFLLLASTKINSFFSMLFFISICNIVYAAESMVGQVNGMMCIKCQKMVTEALQKACPEATVKVSWPEGVAVSSFADKSNLNEEEYKKTILGTGFEVVKVIKVGKIIEDPSAAVSALAN